MDLTTVLLQELNLYPKLTVQDIYKMLYGSVFGPKHALKSIDRAKESFFQEWDYVNDDSQTQLYDDITIVQPMVRVHLSKCKALLFKKEDVFEWFCKSAEQMQKREENEFRDVIKRVYSVVIQAPFSFSTEQANKLLSWIQLKPFPVCSHSDVFKDLYNPHYRFISPGCIKTQ